MIRVCRCGSLDGPHRHVTRASVDLRVGDRLTEGRRIHAVRHEVHDGIAYVRVGVTYTDNGQRDEFLSLSSRRHAIARPTHQKESA